MTTKAEYTRCLNYLNAQRKFPIDRDQYINNLREDLDIALPHKDSCEGRYKIMTLRKEIEKARLFLRLQARFEEKRSMTKEQALEYAEQTVAEYRRVTWGDK